LADEPEPVEAALDDDLLDDLLDDDSLDDDSLDDDSLDDDSLDDDEPDELAAGSFEPLPLEPDSPDDPFEPPADLALADRLSVR
jgi:hypothetical protein